MEKRNLLLGLVLVLWVVSVKGQEVNSKFGLKGGANYAKYTPDVIIAGINVAEYRRKFGFYFGGFININIHEKIKIQPEILFAMQGSKFLAKGFEIRGGANEVPIASDFKVNINESTIIIPIIVQYSFTNDFYMEMGPQFGYIIDRKQKIKEDPFEQFQDINVLPFSSEYDKFDLGLTVGTGYRLSNHFGINGRFFFSLIERDNSIKTSVFNLGIEYTL
ncbi:porin family protein [Aquimarina sp. Aq78]|uniref:porin family protein n=1 Tax=Aquimarina sp. Aq78 TaxID=1191889 RepID=UPI000D10F8D3|nr:porin family protein [Aquimarina sp. Aq78]